MANTKFCSDLPLHQHDECLWLHSFVLATVLHLQYNKSIPSQFNDKPVCASSLSILLSCPIFLPPSPPALLQEPSAGGSFHLTLVLLSEVSAWHCCLFRHQALGWVFRDATKKKLNLIKLNPQNVKWWDCISVLRADLSALMDLHLTRGNSW